MNFGMEVFSEVPISLSFDDSGFVDLLWNTTEEKTELLVKV
jgi:hypothetical protein